MSRGRIVNRLGTIVLLCLCACLLPASAAAEDGYALWLRYVPLDGEAGERLRAAHLVIGSARDGEDETVRAARSELARGLAGLSGRPAGPSDDGREIQLECGKVRPSTGTFTIAIPAGNAPVIAAADGLGCLYGAFALLRELSLGTDPAAIELAQTPAMPLRLLNHWDDPDGHVERGYAGRSIFDWWHLPEVLDDRMIDYARANASLGINGAVVNNVNASALFLTPRYLPKLKRLADAWRSYGIRLYVSAKFSAPVEIGGLATADPLDPAVRAWWRAKADEIYAAVPDFGGFLVKANSEGQPGPQDYGRSHAEGANMLAEAIGARGVVIWRAFVYSAQDQTDRTKQAYAEFTPLDGTFAANVILQIKNGPLDFQPREPFHPLFGAMPRTRTMLEVQITKEYLGQASHLVFLAPMWKEVLDADTGRGGTVAEVVAPAGMAGVANTGSNRNWTGGNFDQANWYAFGRLAWDPHLSAETIAREWAALTFSRDPRFLAGVVPMMLASRQVAVDTMTPLGLAHQMGTGHHYGPAPWVCDLERPEWNPCYYSRADAYGIGFVRAATGSNALAQYVPQVAERWADPKTIDEDYLLWFHHLPWDFRTRSGRTLWDELVFRYDRGVGSVDAMANEWQALASFVDPERHRAVAERLAIQRREARWWRDASLAYWQSLNDLELAPGVRPPEHSLDHYRNLSFPEAPGQ